jgi:nitrosocyanin
MRKLAMAAVVGGIAIALSAGAMAQQASPAAASTPAGSTPSAARPEQAAKPAPEEVKKFTVVAVMIDDVKFWLPSTIVVDQGDKVQLTLKNQVPGKENQHGFSIPEYKITELVTRGEPKTVEFTADKPGVFAYYCQVHPAHVGGQLIVRPRRMMQMMRRHEEMMKRMHGSEKR